MGSFIMGFKQIIVLTIASIQISCLEIEEAEKRCVPFSTCNEINWLFRNPDIAANFDMNELQCGFGTEPLVWCHNNEYSITRHNSATDMISSSDECSGHLQVYFVSQRRGLKMVKLQTSKRRTYSRISRITNVYRVAVRGNCCWKLHQRPNFRGEFNHLELGFDAPFTERLASAQAVEC